MTKAVNCYAAATGEDDEGDGIGQGDEENEEEEMERGSRSYADHAFEFSAFELVSTACSLFTAILS